MGALLTYSMTQYVVYHRTSLTCKYNIMTPYGLYHCTVSSVYHCTALACIIAPFSRVSWHCSDVYRRTDSRDGGGRRHALSALAPNTAAPRRLHASERRNTRGRHHSATPHEHAHSRDGTTATGGGPPPLPP